MLRQYLDGQLGIGAKRFVSSIPFIAIGKGACSSRAIWGRLALHWRSYDLRGNNGETWFESDIHRIVGEIEILSPERDAAKAKTNFERALEMARVQQARSWELRAAMSMTRLWRDQGKRPQAHDLLAPVYGWFTRALRRA
jgi:hypothetical protein